MSIQSTTQNIQQFTDSMKKLGVHVSNVKSMGLLLLKYIRGECLFQDTQTIFCRGLILDADNFQPICVPPEKSQKFPYFLQNIEDWGKVIIEEFIGSHPKIVKDWLPQDTGLYQADPAYKLTQKQKKHKKL